MQNQNIKIIIPMTHVMCHLSPALHCLLSKLYILVNTVFMLKPLEALLPWELDGTTDLHGHHDLKTESASGPI